MIILIKYLNCELIILNKPNNITVNKRDLIHTIIEYLNLIDKN